jgi:hypothetical protein
MKDLRRRSLLGSKAVERLFGDRSAIGDSCFAILALRRNRRCRYLPLIRLPFREMPPF